MRKHSSKVWCRFTPNTRAQGTRIRPKTWREEAVTLNARLACYSFCRNLVSYLFWWTVFLSHLILAIDSFRLQTTLLQPPGKAGWLCLQLPHRPSLSHYSYWPGLFVAQGHEEDIPPVLHSLSLIETGSKTTLQKKSLLWAALLEENESPKQIGFHDLRQTSLFILYNPV